MFHVPTNVVTVAPLIEPVTVAEVKANAFIVDDSSDDEFIRNFCITPAREYVETLACRSLITQTRRQSYDDMPSGFMLRFGPVQSVSSITYYDENDTQQTMAATLYDVDTYRAQSRVVPGYGDSWPASLCKVNAVNVTYVAGFGSSAASVPSVYRRAIILLASHWAINRDQLGCVEDDLTAKLLDIIAT
jgi:uncharacterized phiE125 gp8 family phage protein